MFKIFISLCYFAIIARTLQSDKMRHFIPHTHDDLGWLMTVQEYYDQRVRNIFDSVLDALLNTPKSENSSTLLRKFVYSEIGFLKIYLNENSDTRSNKINKIKGLINNNQWEFVNGGISQSDSACPHYEDIIENYFYGLSYIKRVFDQTSMGGWQLDPFGHSKALLYISRLFGMKHAVINRIGDFKKAKMFENHTLEFIQKYPDGLSQTIHVTTNMYSSPDGVNCDGDCNFDNFDKNRLDNFLNAVDKRYAYDAYHLIGDDFNYQKAQNNFNFLDQVLGLYSDIKYSLFSDYLKSFEEKEKNLTEFDGDFFVYDEANNDSWSGYFTSKPLLKNKIKRIGRLLRAFKNLYFSHISKNADNGFKYIDELLDIAENFGVLLHHDCITGTAKRAVDEDYFKRIKDIDDRLNKFVSEYLNTDVHTCDLNTMITDEEPCIINDSENKGELYIHLYNSSNYNYNKRLTKFTVLNKFDHTIKLQKMEKDAYIEVEADILCKSKYCDIFVQDSTSSYSLSVYKVSYAKNNTHNKLLLKSKSNNKHQNESIITDDGMNQSELFNGVYETKDWTVIVSDNNVIVSSKQDQFLINGIYYEYLDAEDSGAYILKYNGKPNFKPYNKFKKATLTLGKFADVVVIEGDRIDLTITFDHNYQDLYEITSYVKKDEKFLDGIDVILNVHSFTITNWEFKTDSNGLFEMTRQKNEKYENSIYPVASFIKIEDNSDENMTIFVDRAQGGTSTGIGNVKLYIQRSAIRDDHKGVDEILMVNEDVNITHKILNSNSQAYSERFVDVINMIEQEPAIYYSLKDFKREFKQDNTVNQFNNINLRIVSDFIDDNSFFIRIQNINRETNVAERYTYNDLLTQIYGSYKFEEVPFDYLFNGKSQNDKLAGVNSFIDIKPLEFKSFIAKL